MASDQTGFSGRGGSPDGHYHDGSWYRDSECRCALSKPGTVPPRTEIGEAYAVLCAVTGHAARGALTHLSPEEVAAELHALADAIDGTTDVAESMYAIPPIPRAQWQSIGVDFSEVE